LWQRHCHVVSKEVDLKPHAKNGDDIIKNVREFTVFSLSG
jgi:hypothetical protein